MEALVEQLGYLSFFLVLVLGGVGLPVPEEVPIILAGVLSRKGTMLGPIAFGSCLLGVIVGDFVVYFLGYFYGEKVMSLPLTRKFLTKARETQIQGYFHRHGIKILILGRFAVGFRTAAYLTAGILKLPPLNLFLTDLCAATFSTSLMFGLGYIFARQIENATEEIHRWQHWITFGLALGGAVWLLLRYRKARRKIGQPVGPRVLVEDAPLPPDDLHPVASEGPAEMARGSFPAPLPPREGAQRAVEGFIAEASRPDLSPDPGESESLGQLVGQAASPHPPFGHPLAGEAGPGPPNEIQTHPAPET